MGIYTVHMKGTSNEPSAAERAVFVREGFGWAAFFFGPLWLLWNRAWIALLVWMLLHVALAFCSHAGLIHPLSQSALEFVIALALGFEASQLRRHALQTRGFRLVDVVHEAGMARAERLFFSRWEPAAKVADVTNASTNRAAPGMVGLFPGA